jgi:hypothetical protein
VCWINQTSIFNKKGLALVAGHAQSLGGAADACKQLN